MAIQQALVVEPQDLYKASLRHSKHHPNFLSDSGRPVAQTSPSSIFHSLRACLLCCLLRRDKIIQNSTMNVMSPRYPPYPLSRALIDPRYPASRALEPCGGSRYALEPPLPRSRTYVNCGAGISPRGEHLCRTCLLTTHAANQVLNIRGGDHCDCPACDLAGLDDDRDMGDLIDRGGYYVGG